MRLRDNLRNVFASYKSKSGFFGRSSVLSYSAIRLIQGLTGHEAKSLQVHPTRAKYPLNVRLRGSSDINVLYQIFAYEEYATMRDLEDVNVIIDLGANVGYSSAYFCSCFPNARIVAVEPDDRNFAALRLNLTPYGDRVHSLHGAVWSSCASLSLSKGSFRDGREWTTQVVDPPAGSVGDVQGWDIEALIEISNAPMVDLLKIDIEGAELNVFGEGRAAWIHRVRNLCIELHGDKCEEVFFRAMENFEFEESRAGELTICKNIRAA